MDTKIRTAESATSDVFININDLIIELMLLAEETVAQDRKDTIKKVIKKLTDIRNESHGKS